MRGLVCIRIRNKEASQTMHAFLQTEMFVTGGGCGVDSGQIGLRLAANRGALRHDLRSWSLPVGVSSCRPLCTGAPTCPPGCCWSGNELTSSVWAMVTVATPYPLSFGFHRSTQQRTKDGPAPTVCTASHERLHAGLQHLISRGTFMNITPLHLRYLVLMSTGQH